jgi:hypothetical protein
VVDHCFDDRTFHPLEWLNGWRVAALLFSAGGIFLSAVCLLLMLHPVLAAIFGPGYFITAGYIWRGFGNPSRLWSRRIWFASMLVQGLWLTLLTVNLIWSFPGAEEFQKLTPGLAWWFATTLVSALGVVFDGGEPTAA